MSAGIRLTGGRHRGRVLRGAVPPGVRPTSGRVREALFSMLGQDLAGCSVLDAFGGTGLLALEAASRGAAPVTVFERNGRNATRIRQWAAELGEPVTVRVGDAAHLLGTGTWTVVLMDPPYADDPARWLAAAGTAVGERLVYEAAGDRTLPEATPELVREKLKRYGDTQLAVYRRLPPSSD